MHAGAGLEQQFVARGGRRARETGGVTGTGWRATIWPRRWDIRFEDIFIFGKRIKKAGFFFDLAPFATDPLLLCELSALSMARG